MKQLIQKLFLLLGVLFFMVPDQLSALPSFTRQTGKNCTVCHVQNMEKLNSYGRNFALFGYTPYNTESETQTPIEGSDVALGIPAVLNASAVLKARYVKSNDVYGQIQVSEEYNETRDEIQVLEGSGLYFGGRIADNIGGIVSLNGDPSPEYDVVFGAKAILSYETFNGYSGASLYSTQINGIFSGMENYNTGLYAPLKQFENSSATNAAQATGIGNGPATGLQLYYGDNNFFVTLGASIPSQNSEGMDTGGSFIQFGRLSYNQPIGMWNFMIGTYGLYGDVKASDQSLNRLPITSQAKMVNIHKKAYGADLEMSGPIMGMMTMTTINVVMKNIVDISPPALLSNPNLQITDNQATSLEFQINPLTPLGVKIAYLDYKNNDDAAVAREFIKAYDFQAYSAGLSYLLRQNISLGIEYSQNYPKPKIMEGYYDLYLSAIVAF